jgi:hypothetical protein
VQKPRRKIIWRIVVTSFIVAIISYRMVKIVRKQEMKELLAESVTPSIIWEFKVPESEFIGDLSQVGSYLLYALPNENVNNAWLIKAQRLDNGIITEGAVKEDMQPLADPLIIGKSRLGKKEFRIEYDGKRAIVAQYNIATGARGLIAKLPEQCTEWKTLQRLPQNFFALEGLCSFPSHSEQPSKRILVLDFETRRLTYVSGPLAKNVRFIAFK